MRDASMNRCTWLASAAMGIGLLLSYGTLAVQGMMYLLPQQIGRRGRKLYKQFDDLVTLYNEKFAKPSTKMINDLIADGVLNKNAPFEHQVQWTYWELWHHEGRRARHGASMMSPDYTHWHGMYEVSKHYYTKFLPEVVEAAATKGIAMKQKYERIVGQLLAQDEHMWMKDLSAKEAEELRKMYQSRYNQ